MGNTPNFALPYPELTDTPDVPRDIKALATKLDGLAGLTPTPPPAFIAAGGALPSAPVDGQEVYYCAHEANGIVWHLRYRAGASNARKWECVGGAPLFAGFANTNGVNATGVPDLVVNVPLVGDYLIRSGIRGQSNAYPFAARVFITYVGQPANTVLGDDIAWFASPSNGAPAFAREGAASETRATIPVTGNVTGDTQDLAGNPVIYSAWMSFTPVRF